MCTFHKWGNVLLIICYGFNLGAFKHSHSFMIVWLETIVEHGFFEKFNVMFALFYMRKPRLMLGQFIFIFFYLLLGLSTCETTSLRHSTSVAWDPGEWCSQQHWAGGCWARWSQGGWGFLSTHSESGKTVFMHSVILCVEIPKHASMPYLSQEQLYTFCIVRTEIIETWITELWEL